MKPIGLLEVLCLLDLASKRYLSRKHLANTYGLIMLKSRGHKLRGSDAHVPSVLQLMANVIMLGWPCSVSHAIGH